MRPQNKILLPGGSGLLGQLLAPYLAEKGYHITILSRNPKPHPHPNIQSLPWNAKSPGPWQAQLETAAALINLTGHSVNCRYTQSNREKIYHSRIDSTRLLGQAIRHPHQTPASQLHLPLPHPRPSPQKPRPRSQRLLVNFVASLRRCVRPRAFFRTDFSRHDATTQRKKSPRHLSAVST